MDPERVNQEIKKAVREELGGEPSELLFDHALNPRNLGTLSRPDGQAALSGICEDTIRIQIKLKGERIEEIRFMTNGCAATVACSSMATELAKGATVWEALRIDGRRIKEALGGLSIEHTHCADLAANTLKAAIRDALETLREPWKRLYKTSEP